MKFSSLVIRERGTDALLYFAKTPWPDDDTQPQEPLVSYIGSISAACDVHICWSPDGLQQAATCAKAHVMQNGEVFYEDGRRLARGVRKTCAAAEKHDVELDPKKQGLRDGPTRPADAGWAEIYNHFHQASEAAWAAMRQAVEHAGMGRVDPAKFARVAALNHLAQARAIIEDELRDAIDQGDEA